VPTHPPAEVTVVNGQAWALRPDHIAELLQRAAPGAVIADPTGAAADPDRLATVTDPQFWSGQPAALAEALAASLPGQPPITERPPAEGRSSGAASTSAPGRLTLTVEEAAALLGISRAFAYEAVRRGEIPSIRIGRRVLVPRVALDRLVNGPSYETPSASDPV
jgi:excisionase family DNA binding protein